MAVFVDKDIYQNAKSDIEWYATDYIQQRISNSKALVLPINTQNFKAIDVVRMLENMYFDGIKWETSDLLWAVFIWDIPLPVVQNNGFIYPTIFPYVDFEEQQFVYDANQQFFVYNNNPRGQAEIWHWILNFWSEDSKYHDFFQKLRKYAAAPADFVAPLLWYDDFVAMKTTFAEDTLPFYINNFLFTEDIWYHRFTNLMLDYFKQVQNDDMSDLIDWLASVSQNNPELTQIMLSWAGTFDALGESSVPTTMLLSVIKELITRYENLYPGVFLSTIKDNTQAAARWYKKTGSGERVDGVDSHIHKVALKDSLTLWDAWKWISPIMISFNDAMEEALDKKIESNNWYMTIPVIAESLHQDRTNKKKRIWIFPKRWCERTTNDLYKNYYFGTFAQDIVSAQEFSAYRWTFRNLDSFSGVALLNTGYGSSNGKTLGASNSLFATQVEANRGYNIMAAAGDYDTYNENKVKQKKQISCSRYFRILRIDIFCMTKKTKSVWEKDETVEDFSLRGRWWASSLNLDSGALSANPPVYKLQQYDYLSAMFPIYNIGWSSAVATGKTAAYSFLGAKSFPSVIKVKDRYWVLDYPKYLKWDKDAEVYPLDIYSSEQDWYRELIGTKKIRKSYEELDYFSIWNKSDDKWSKKWKTIDVNWINQERKSSDSMWWKCDGKREIFDYTYKTIDSRVKNTAPTPDQINGTYQNEFSEQGLFWKHYDYLNTELLSLQEDSKLSFSQSYSGLLSLLSGNKEINSGINSFVSLTSSDPLVLLSWAKNILSQTGHQEYIETFSWVFSSLEQSSDLLPALSFWLVLSYFDRIQEIESLYNQKTQFLSGWSNDLKKKVIIIRNQYNSLPNSFAQINWVYTSITTTNAFATWLLATKRKNINDLQNCWTVTANYCWCANLYKQVCDYIDALTWSLNNLSQTLYTLRTTTVTEDIDWTPTPIEIKILSWFEASFEDAATETGFLSDIPLVLSGINSIKTVDKVPPLTKTPWLNQTTADRPIDWPRSITFQWLWWSLVTFVYPNVYDIPVYKQEWSILTLKTIEEINQSMLDYLLSKTKEYNTLLLAQEKTRQQHYNKNPAAFNFLATSDSLASPNTRSTVYLPEDFFVSLIGKQRIYDLAELLYYQTLPVYTKQKETYVDKDLNATRTAFDLNKKISYIVSGYLTQHPDQWSLITPAYNASWYEVAYINSDRSDYISAAEIPKFIQKLQDNKKTVANTFIEDSVLASNDLFSATRRQCWIDSSYTELIFDLKEKEGKWKMPWITALQCWWSTLGSSVKFDVSMEVGPSFGEFLSWLKGSFDDWKNSFSKITNSEKSPWADFSGNISEYRSNIVLIDWDDTSLLPKIKTFSLEIPTTKLLAWSQLPIAISAKDFSGNSVSRVMDSYVVYVATGNWEFIWGGLPWPQSMEFSDFDNTMLVYQAPIVNKPTTVTFSLTWADAGAKKTITVTPGDFQVSFWSKKLYTNNKAQSKLEFTLTEIDSTYSTIPRIIVSLRAQDGSQLQTPFTIFSKNWLVTPWVVSSGNFVSLGSFFLEKAEQAIFLMPSYRAGTDEIWIQIPGLDPIIIPVTVTSWKPYHVNLTTSAASLSIWESLSGSLSVTDAWGNTISTPTSLVLGFTWALDFPSKIVQVSDEQYNFSLKTKEKGGIWYVYASINDLALEQQSPAYQKIVIQEKFLPEKKLNVMYLNLFGSDRWNLWTQDALDPSYVPDLVSSSEKLLSVTTQIVEPSRIKKFAAVVSEHGQVRNFSEREVTLQILSWSLVAEFDGIWYIPLTQAKPLTLFSSEDPFQTAKELSKKDSASLVFSKNTSLQELNFELTDNSLSFSGEVLFNFKKDIWNSWLSIELSEKMDQGYSIWNVIYQEEELWKLYFIQAANKSLDLSEVVVYSSIAYDKTITFAEWTTNWEKGIWIIDLLGTFEKEGYLSIEDSTSYAEGIGFRSDFKNITLFGDGKTVWESTIPFGSQFLINFWDPLLSRISENVEIKSVDLDLWIGEQVYTNTSKAIFKVLNTDINNDGLTDIITVFSDGTIKLLKNYWGTHPYTNMQDLMRLSDSIKDIFVGDVDWNNYPDILVWTNNQQLRVYKNDKWVLDVDGNMICLNINADGTKIQKNPESVAWLQQLFFEDMDKDGNIDIVTNDVIWDIKIFYGWSKNGQWHYVSTLQYACDDDWHARQKESVRLVKSYGVVIEPDFYIQDESMVHVKGWSIDAQTPISSDQVNDLVTDTGSMNPEMGDLDLWSFVWWMANSFQNLAADSLSNQLTVAPISYIPSYEENSSLDDIWYKTLLQLSGDASLSVYKQYKDNNGGVLLSWDVVKITTTILWLKNNIEATYIDRLIWPWEILSDDADKILSFKKELGNFTEENITWLDSDEALFVLDDINLDFRQSLRFSYDVVYLWEPTVSIEVKDVLFSDANKKKDTYSDIIVFPADSCKKYRRVFFNNSSQSHRNYDEVYDNIQAKLDVYTAKWQAEWDALLAWSMPTTSSDSFASWSSASNYQDGVNDILDQIDMDGLFESWTVTDLFSQWQANLSFDMKALDTLMAPVSEDIDKILDGLCQWFKLWAKAGCQPPVPFNKIPFNQAFLGAWEYHIFGCFQNLLKPISSTLGKGLPVLSVPGNRWPTPAGYLPLPDIFGFPVRMAGSDDFFIGWPQVWSYSSWVRLYLVPTLTLQMGVAICFGPTTLWKAIPPLFRDLWGNCVVVAFPLYACNGGWSWSGDEPVTEELEPWMSDLANNGSCEQPLQQSSAKVVSNTLIIQQPTYPSAFRLSSLGSQNSSWTMAVPNWNFGWFGYISFNSKPTKKRSTTSYWWMESGFGFDALSFVKWPKIDLKIKDSNAKGIIKSLVKDWLGRQVKYMINNLTKLTINVTLPDVSQLADGFDSLFSAADWSDASEKSQEDDANYANVSKDQSTLDNLKAIWSKQNFNAMTSSVNNPFESLITMFQSVPLVDLYTKDIVFKIPLPTTDDLLKYDSYLRWWLKNQQKILKQWLEAIHELASICGGITPAQAKRDLVLLEEEIIEINKMNKQSTTLKKLIDSAWKEKIFLQKVINWDIVTQTGNIIIDDIPAVFTDIGRQFQFFSQKLISLPRLKTTEVWLRAKPNPTAEDRELLLHIQDRVSSLSTCATFSADIDWFTSFYNQATSLVKNVQQNIQILEKYKQFPLQLYDWMHFVDRYMADIMNFVSTLSSTLIWWVNVNAKIYAKRIDALVLILSAIKTWQVIIDLSVNWTKKCGKCSRDGYGSHGCSLGFLFPQIPIIPIPAFKIPNINIDLSHVDMGISIALPRFVFTPVDFPLPQLPNLPTPPDFNLAAWFDFSIQFNYDLPEIPLLPEPPTLPELPSFIPKIDFSLPLLPPAPKIPNIIPEISSIIEIADFVVKIFCILKKGFGLVGEEWVKAKVEQMTQRTWDVPIFDFFNQTFTWKTDPKPQWFDLQLDGFLQFKMDFSWFYGFLNQIAETANSFSYNVSNSYSKAVNQATSGLKNNKVMDFLNKDIQDVNLDFTVPPLDIPLDWLISETPTLEYDVAYKQLSAWLKEFAMRVDDPDIQKDIWKINSVLQKPAVVIPATKELQSIQKEIQTILIKKQKEISELTKTVSSYDRFVAQLKRNDIALVDDDRIEISFASPLFTTNKETYDLIEQQESPFKAYMDTNATLVNWYLETLSTSSPDELRMTKSDYEQTTEYLEGMKSTIDDVYDKLWFDKISYASCWIPYIASNETSSDQPLLSQTSSSPTTSPTTNFSSDISSYVRWVFVENPQSWTMINVVRSQPYVTKIRDRYFSADINQDLGQDLIMWDTNTIYVKYAKQESQHKNSDTTTSLYTYSPGIFSSSFADSYEDLVKKADDEWYVDFWDISVKLISPVQEVKNFKMVGQSFDAIQMSWTNHTVLWEPADGYLIKLNHRIDTYQDKDSNFRFLDDEFLNKRYILILPNQTNYSWATIDFKERYYYKGKDAGKARDVLDFLSGWTYSELIYGIKFYQPTQPTISIGLNEIPRNWQYAEIVPLKNTNTLENPYYIPQWPWSNQIVAGRQIIADMVWPEAVITLQRPSISEVVSTWSRHKWFVWTYYNLVVDWKDNVAVSNMWIEKDGKLISFSTGTNQTGNIQITWLYFTGVNSLEYLIGAEDFNGNRQLEKATLDIQIPNIALQEFVPVSEFSGKLVAELSHDIDEWMVIFQRQRNDLWQEMSGTLANSYWWFSVWPKQTIVTWSVFSMWNTVGLYDDRWNEIGQISIDGNITILPAYQDTYTVMLDLITWYPLVRVLNKKTSTTVFWIQMPAFALNDVTLYQKEPFYTKIDITQPSFGSFFGWSCIQSLDKECILYISPIGQIYIPKLASTSLVGEYRYDTTTRSVIYVIKDFLEKDIVRITTKTRLMK